MLKPLSLEKAELSATLEDVVELFQRFDIQRFCTAASRRTKKGKQAICFESWQELRTVRQTEYREEESDRRPEE